jgi:hypothetical protein
MAYISSATATGELAYAGSPKLRGRPLPKRGLFGRLLDAMMATRLRQAEREVTRYLAGSGGKFTDEAEREIERRFLSTPSHW